MVVEADPELSDGGQDMDDKRLWKLEVVVAVGQRYSEMLVDGR